MKEKILDKASALFMSYGFKSITMDDLASEMGISKKTIYAHFENKTKLIEACSLCTSRIIEEGIAQIRAHDKNPIEELFDIKEFVMVHVKDGTSSPVFQLQKYYPKIYQTLHKRQFGKMQECIADNLNKGIAQGVYRDNIQVNFMSRLYFHCSMGLRDVKLFPQDEFPTNKMMGDFLEYHIRGIATEKGMLILNQVLNTKED